jgi:mono/diheme cytochrome c family protein
MRRLASRVLVAALLAASAAHARDDADRVRTGEGVYRRHCAQCHGPDADGQGVHAKRFNPPPSNLSTSKRTDDYRMQIITVGGLNMGRSAVMPEWGLELSGQEILDVVVYLRKVTDETGARAAKARPSSSAARRQPAHG